MHCHLCVRLNFFLLIRIRSLNCFYSIFFLFNLCWHATIIWSFGDIWRNKLIARRWLDSKIDRIYRTHSFYSIQSLISNCDSVFFFRYIFINYQISCILSIILLDAMVTFSIVYIQNIEKCWSRNRERERKRIGMIYIS